LKKFQKFFQLQLSLAAPIGAKIAPKSLTAAANKLLGANFSKKSQGKP
jgi:hypothetical protein